MMGTVSNHAWRAANRPAALRTFARGIALAAALACLAAPELAAAEQEAGSSRAATTPSGAEADEALRAARRKGLQAQAPGLTPRKATPTAAPSAARAGAAPAAAPASDAQPPAATEPPSGDGASQAAWLLLPALIQWLLIPVALVALAVLLVPMFPSLGGRVSAPFRRRLELGASSIATAAARVTGWWDRDRTVGDLAPELREALARFEANAPLDLRRSHNVAPPPTRPALDVDDDAEIEPGAYQVVTIVSAEGGLAPSTLAANLAVHLRAMDESRAVLLLSLDSGSLCNRMFTLDPDATSNSIVDGALVGSLAWVIRMGDYGVEHVLSDPEVLALEQRIESPLRLRSVLHRTGFQGVVIIDANSEFETLTRAAVHASDVTLVPVADDESLEGAARLMGRLVETETPTAHVRFLVTPAGRREGAPSGAAFSHLFAQVRSRGWPLFRSIVAHDPETRMLVSNPADEFRPVLRAAPGSVSDNQLRHLVDELVACLETAPERPVEEEAPRAARWLDDVCAPLELGT